MYNASVQAIVKHKQSIFRHLSTAVDNRVFHNNNKQFLQSMIKRMKIIVCGIWLNYRNKVQEKMFFDKFQQNYGKNAKKYKKCEKCRNLYKKCDNARENAIAFF